MSRFQGFFNLQEPKDLLAKLEYDYKRLQNSPRDTYAAFDFFVTGYHILDWLYPDDEQKRRQETERHIILQVCSHIANGIKHFQAKARWHKSVIHADVAFQSDMSQENASQAEDLVIELGGEAASHFGTDVKCLDLATKVLEFWQEYLG